ncbi:V-type ATP synthase subunit D [Myceligenerans indicum]|uniref:V-type ATPase, D subunit n=1 Tax=Myceligenerans indicum TaxID=2593663 RepID=A0ABS1LGZ4_9MICO|nr:V-type ATP synthase subunit D [Myceligenerans indicum]MBL0885413.1 V-type ATPase, D subunit [Myceligenerans indicum]
MMAQLRVPPGRTGRLWLRDRLALADRGVSLLERKLRILLATQQRLAIQLEDARHDWTRCAAEARRWALRAGLAGGRRSFRLASGAPTAQVRFGWTVVMGVRYPDRAECDLPGSDRAAVVVGNAAVVHARAAHRRAVQAGAQYAAALAAVRTVDQEVDTTRARARALRRHWIPRLRAELTRTELALEEAERADAIRLRWASGTGGGSGRIDRQDPGRR